MSQGPRFTEVFAALRSTWPDRSRKVQVLAARYYCGGETLETLRSLAEPQAIASDPYSPEGTYFQRAPLTLEEVDFIIQMR